MSIWNSIKVLYFYQADVLRIPALGLCAKRWWQCCKTQYLIKIIELKIHYPFITILILCVLNSFVNCKAQNTRILFNTKINENIDSLTSEIKNVKGYIEVKHFLDDSLVFDNYGKYEKIRFYQEPFIRNDTIGFVIGVPKGLETIVIFNKDSVYFEALALDGLIGGFDDSNRFSFKYPDKKVLTLIKKPLFREGEFVEGEIEFTSVDYVDYRDPKEKKQKFQFRMYFRIEIVKEMFDYK